MEIDLSTDAPPSPERTLQLADAMADIARTLNHPTGHHEALRYPSEADRLIRSLETVAERLPQLCEQISRWLRQEQGSCRIEVNHGPYAGDAHAAYLAAAMRLDAAKASAHALLEDLEAASSVTSTMGGTED